MTEILDNGPFYHGTKADLLVGELLTAGFNSNYRPEVIMNHIYFTARLMWRGLVQNWLKVMDLHEFILLSLRGALKMIRTLQTKNFQAIQHGRIAPPHL